MKYSIYVYEEFSFGVRLNPLNTKANVPAAQLPSAFSSDRNKRLKKII